MQALSWENQKGGQRLMILAVTKKVMEVFLNLSFPRGTKNDGACRTSTLKSLRLYFFIKNLKGQSSRFFV